MMGAALLALLLTASPADPPLLAAESAFEQGLYQDVLPAVERALKQDLTLPERRRAFELVAVTHAAFNDSASAIAAFRQVLALDNNYLPSALFSPKVRALFEEARRLGPAPGGLTRAPAAALQGGPRDTPMVEQDHASSSIFRQPWFWAGVGVLAVGAGAGVYVLSGPRVPVGNLGRDRLR
jgi:hypothetical protein